MEDNVYPGFTQNVVSKIIRNYYLTKSICFMSSIPQILKSINFTVEEGQTVALLGDKGSGKSALIKLLQRIYDPQTGKVSQTKKNYSVASAVFCTHCGLQYPTASLHALRAYHTEFQKCSRLFSLSTSSYVVALCILCKLFLLLVLLT